MKKPIQHGARLSRRELIKSAFGGAVVISGRGLLAATPQSVTVNPSRRVNDGDLVLANGKFVDGSGVVGSVITIKNGRIVKVGQARSKFYPNGLPPTRSGLRGSSVRPNSSLH